MENPDDADAYLTMADLALREGQWTVAGLLSDKALAIAQAFKGDAEKKKDLLKRAYTGEAYTAREHEQWEDARKVLTALLKVEADNARAHYQLGQVLFELKKPKEAYAELQAAARMDEDVPSPEATLGQLYEKAKDRTNAEKWMKQAVAADPKKIETRLEVRSGYCRSAGSTMPRLRPRRLWRSIPNRNRRRFSPGASPALPRITASRRSIWRRPISSRPGAGREANELALTLNELGEEERKRAVTLADANVRQNRQSAEAVATLGWIYYRLGRMEDAESLLNQVVASNQAVSPDALYFYAVVADNRNRGQAAKSVLDTALESDAPFAYRLRRARLHDRLAKDAAAAGAPRPTKRASGTKSDAAKADNP